MSRRSVSRLRDRLDIVGIDAGRSRQAVVIAQGLAGVLLAEQAALAQDRHHLFGENVESARQPGRHNVEAVGRAVLEPGLEVVRDLFRRPSDHPMAASTGQPLHQLADGRLFAIDDVDDELETAGNAAGTLGIDQVAREGPSRSNPERSSPIIWRSWASEYSGWINSLNSSCQRSAPTCVLATNGP